MTMRKDEILKDRESGMTYQQIADKHGVSKAYVGAVCSRYHPSYFKVITEKNCVFPGLREWMNRNRVSINELSRRLKEKEFGNDSTYLRERLSGETEIRKNLIDELIKMTGLKYEQLFGD